MLQRSRDEKLYAKFCKCEFELEFISFLGHVVTKDGDMIDLSKIAAIPNWARPTYPTEIQNFICLAGYYQNFL